MSTCFLNVLGQAEVVRHAVAAANKWAPRWLAAMTRARAILLKCDPPLKIANLHVEVVDTRGVDDVRARRDPVLSPWLDPHLTDLLIKNR